MLLTSRTLCRPGRYGFASIASSPRCWEATVRRRTLILTVCGEPPPSGVGVRRGGGHPAAYGRGAVRGLGRRYEASVAAVRDALGEKDFDSAWAEGAALSTEEAIAYAQRGRGQRKRPATGWASLTPAEHDVVQLVSEGLGNKDIATRLFISPRTVQTHLTHVYTKLGLTSRVQLVQEAARHA